MSHYAQKPEFGALSDVTSELTTLQLLVAVSFGSIVSPQLHTTARCDSVVTVLDVFYNTSG